jgi:hypothetical protein
MYLTWLLISLLHSVFGNSFVPYCSWKKTSRPKTQAAFLFVRSALLRLQTTTGRLALNKESKRSCSGTDRGSLFSQLRYILPACTSQQFKAKRKNQAASHPAFYRLIQISHINIVKFQKLSIIAIKKFIFDLHLADGLFNFKNEFGLI